MLKQHATDPRVIKVTDNLLKESSSLPFTDTDHMLFILPNEMMILIAQTGHPGFEKPVKPPKDVKERIEQAKKKNEKPDKADTSLINDYNNKLKAYNTYNDGVNNFIAGQTGGKGLPALTYVAF